jgi:hypothetical protein
MKWQIFKKRAEDFDYHQLRSCKNCLNSFTGRYCNACGEKVIELEDRSFKRLAESVLNAFTFLDGKFLKSFKLIILSPGKLSANVREGIQVPYMKLVGLFFVANFFYFLFPVFDTFNSKLYTQFYQQGYSDIVQSVVRDYIKANNIDFEKFTTEYNAQSGNLAKLLIIILVGIYTIPLSIINFSRKNLFFDHLQLSFEFHAFLLLINSVILPHILLFIIRLVSMWFGVDWSSLLSDEVYSKLSLVLFFYFFVRAQRTYYKQNWLLAGVKGAILTYLVVISLMVYRFILFFITFWTM